MMNILCLFYRSFAARGVREIAPKVILGPAMFFLFAGTACADIAPPVTAITFYFQKNGTPFSSLVEFTVTCFGTKTNKMPTGYETDTRSDGKPAKIVEFSGMCQEYGCKFDTYGIFGAYGPDVEYCDLEGETEGEKFTVEKFTGFNMRNFTCRDAVDYQFSIGSKYYQRTPIYDICVKKNGDGSRSCERYLKDVTDEIEENEKGYPFEEKCEIKIDIPSDSLGEQLPREQESAITTKTFSLLKDIFLRAVGFVECLFVRLSGGGC